MVQGAAFCHVCGEQQPTIIHEPATDSSHSVQTGFKKQHLPENTSPEFIRARKRFIDLFSYVYEFESFFHEVYYLNIIGRLQEFKNRHRDVMNHVESISASLPEDLKVLATIYDSKFKILEQMSEITRNLRLDPDFKDSFLFGAFQIVNQHKPAIDYIKNDNLSCYNELVALKKHAENLSSRLSTYSVTSRFLRLGRHRLNRGSRLMVLEIDDDRAKVLFLGLVDGGDILDRSIRLSELERRTTWERGNCRLYKSLEEKLNQ